MELQGLLVGKYPTQEITETYKKRDFVIKTLEQYPQEIILEVTQDKVTLLDNFKKGDVLNCSINIRGRRYEKDGNTRFFNSIQAWRIEKNESKPNPSNTDFPDAPEYGKQEEDDDLPF